MAETLLRKHAGNCFEACSAGLTPTQVNPLTIRVLEEVGIDTSTLYAKGTNEFLGKVAIRYAIVVCDKAQQSCPRLYPFALNNLYWPFEDPAIFQGSQQEKLEKFREVRDQIEEKLFHWLAITEERQ